MNRNSSRWTAIATGIATIALTVLSLSSADADVGRGMVHTNGGTLTCCTK